MGLQPKKDWCLIEPMASREDVPHIELPDSAVEHFETADAYAVVSVGPEAKQFDVQEGDIIVIEKGTLSPFKYKGKQYKAVQARYVAFGERGGK